MTLRWRCAFLAYGLILFGFSGLVILFASASGCVKCSPENLRFWPELMFSSLVASLPGFLILRHLTGGRESILTACLAGVSLGFLAAFILYGLGAEAPNLIALIVFPIVGAIAGLAQLWLERWFDRRWPA